MKIALPQPLRSAISRMPSWPPSFALTRVLDLVLRDAIRAGHLEPLYGKVISIRVSDLGVRLLFTLDARGFWPSRSRALPDLTFIATAQDFYLLATRREDPDALFFSRRLAIEGDTELGLVAKNTLDALDLAVIDLSPASAFSQLKHMVYGGRA